MRDLSRWRICSHFDGVLCLRQALSKWRMKFSNLDVIAFKSCDSWIKEEVSDLLKMIFVQENEVSNSSKDRFDIGKRSFRLNR